MSNTRPNLKLRPNFNLKNASQLQEAEEPVPEVKEVKPEPKINTRPFIRPPSSKKEETRQSIVYQEPLAESKVDEQKQQSKQYKILQGRTPINGFRKFNLQAPAQPIVQEDAVINSQFQGPVINMKAKKEKIQQEVMQLQQEELRQKVQVKIQSRPLNQPEANIFKPPEANEGAEIFKKGKAIRPTKQMEPLSKDTIKVSELLENKIKFTSPAIEEEPVVEQTKSTRTRAPQPSAETIEIEQGAQQVTIEKTQVDLSKTNKKMGKTTKKLTKEVVQQQQKEEPMIQEPIIPETQEIKQQIPIQNSSKIDDYKERSIPKFNTTTGNVSLSKKESQKQRVKELKQLISLEIDDYSNQLVVQPRTEYETYLNHIKANILRNSNDQAFDDRITIDTQTDEFQTNDFGGQCPEDYNRTFLSHRQQQKNNRLSEFIEMACEIMEEILSQDNNNIQELKQDQYQFQIPKQISNTFKCKSLNVVTHQISNNILNIFQSFYIENDENKWLNGSIIIQYPKNILYYIPSQITTLSCNSNFLICGNSDGQLAGWSINDKGLSNKYTDKIKQLLKDQYVVKCLFFSSEWNLQILDQFADSSSNTMSSIQQVQFNQQVTLIHEVVGMDVFGNIQVWQIQDLRYDEQEKLYVELGIKSKYKFILRNQINRGYNKICSSISVTTDNILICGPNKVINVNQLKSYTDDQYMQPLVISNVYNNYFCVGYVDGFIKLFHKDFSKSIWNNRVSHCKILWIYLFNGIIALIDKQQQLHIFDLNIKQDEAIVNKQICTSDNQKFSYSYVQNDGINIVMHDKNNQLSVFKEPLNQNSKSNILDTLYQDYYGQ